tara:strand:+ start:11447 stop:11548 length:102 start_codon:yes stop_codon:yes gene_type:complete
MLAIDTVEVNALIGQVQADIAHDVLNVDVAQFE